MLLSEWLFENSDFIDLLEVPTESELSNDLVGVILKVNYGQRIIHEPFESLNSIEVANLLNMRYNKKWKAVTEYLNNGYELGVVNSKDITENYDGTITGNLSGEVTNKESADNVDAFINSDKQENTVVNESANLNTRTRTEKYKSYYSANQQVMNMNNENISNVITKDIVAELCLRIY